MPATTALSGENESDLSWSSACRRDQASRHRWKHSLGDAGWWFIWLQYDDITPATAVLVQYEAFAAQTWTQRPLGHMMNFHWMRDRIAYKIDPTLDAYLLLSFLRVNALYLDKVEAVFAFPTDQPEDESQRNRPTTHDSAWDTTSTREVMDGAKDIVKTLEDINEHMQPQFGSVKQCDNLSLTLAAGLSNYDKAEADLDQHRTNFRAFWKLVLGGSLESGGPVAAQDGGDADAFWFNVSLSCKGRSFVTTSKGYCGLGPLIIQPDDQCYIVKSARVPYVVRSTNKDEMRLLGEAYIHGFMNGERVTKDRDDVDWRDMALN
ncbi:hypothetical protein LTR56_026689 [Elasticomyces elasticus]|nr:hypothetical protein LTR22_027755 [Elasticomyces elasticus]KAK3615275.1 hypothetical protein LTR56_026689 [Elasticomyces elasticus]KAK5736394.1 hypothetical protein LTS12_026178 [Elasticomyces elasticus]